MRYEFSPFCYEHHVEMNRNGILSTAKGGPTEGITFACPEPDCLVHYHSSKGYFMLSQDEKGNGIKPEPGPGVRCEKDGAPMYLSEFLPERRSLRLWKCPNSEAGFPIVRHDSLSLFVCEPRCAMP